MIIDGVPSAQTAPDGYRPLTVLTLLTSPSASGSSPVASCLDAADKLSTTLPSPSALSTATTARSTSSSSSSACASPYELFSPCSPHGQSDAYSLEYAALFSLGKAQQNAAAVAATGRAFAFFPPSWRAAAGSAASSSSSSPPIASTPPARSSRLSHQHSATRLPSVNADTDAKAKKSRKSKHRSRSAQRHPHSSRQQHSAPSPSSSSATTQAATTAAAAAALPSPSPSASPSRSQPVRRALLRLTVDVTSCSLHSADEESVGGSDEDKAEADIDRAFILSELY